MFLSLSLSSYQMYADDLQIYYSFYKDQIDISINKVKEDILSIVGWAVGAGLRINCDKTNAYE